MPSLPFRLVPVLIATCAGAVLLAPAAAAACDSSSCLLVTRGQNGLLAKGAVRVDLTFRRTPMTGLRRGSEPTEQVLRPKVDFENQRLLPGYHQELGGVDTFLQLDVAYGLSSKAALLLSMPVVAHRSFDIGHPPVLRENYSTTGNGDALLGLRYGLHQGKSDSLVGGLSLEVPAGRHRLEGPAGSSDAGILDPTLQPGSGSTDLVAALQYGRRLGTLNGTAAASYQHNTTSSLDYRFGNDAILSLTLSRPLAGRLGGSVQVKAVRRSRSEYLGEALPSTGGRYVYVIPGFSLKAMRNGAVFGYAIIPAYRYVNETQLAPRVGLVIGASRTF